MEEGVLLDLMKNKIELMELIARERHFHQTNKG